MAACAAHGGVLYKLTSHSAPAPLRASPGARSRATIMNTEKIKEILDTVSFIFVTPEFLGEERLKYVRCELRKIRNRMPRIDNDGVAVNIVGSLLLAIVSFIFIVMIWLIPL